MDEVDAVAVPREPLTGALERGGVAVPRDQPQAGKGFEEGVGVAAEADGRVHQHGVAIGERGGEQLDDPVQQYRNVLVPGRHGFPPSVCCYPGEDAADAVRSLSARLLTWHRGRCARAKERTEASRHPRWASGGAATAYLRPPTTQVLRWPRP